MPRTRLVVAVVLAAVMVLSAGCAGFGTDGPADPVEESNGNADDRENESPANDTEATNESSDDGDVPDESSAADGSDDGGSVDDADSTDDADGTDDPEEDDTDSGTSSNRGDTSDSADDGSGNGDASPEDGEGDDAPAENGADGESPENNESNDTDDGESGEEEPVYTLTVEADSPVTLERTWEDASTTREPTDGTAEFSVIEGSYTLSADGYYDVPEEHAIQVDSDTTVTMQREDGAEIAVTVVDAETGEGIEDAEISGVCDWYYSSGDVHVTGETDANGVASARAELAPTDCDATVSAEGYASENVSLVVPDDDGMTVELEPEEPETPETNTLTVEVTDAETGEPIEGADVEAHGADGDPDDTRDLRYDAVTNENGVAEMEVQAAMNYVITVEAEGYETGNGEVSLDREASIELTPEETD